MNTQSQRRSARDAWPYGLGLALGLVAVLAAFGGDGDASMSAGDMDRLRGGNQGSNFKNPTCDLLYSQVHDNAPCTASGAACQTCSTATFQTTGVFAGNYMADQGFPQTCGNLYGGSCVPVGAGFGCQQSIGGNTYTACITPLKLPAPQPIDPAN